MNQTEAPRIVFVAHAGFIGLHFTEQDLTDLGYPLDTPTVELFGATFTRKA